jgi:hypothetical protein
MNGSESTSNIYLVTASTPVYFCEARMQFGVDSNTAEIIILASFLQDSTALWKEKFLSFASTKYNVNNVLQFK